MLPSGAVSKTPGCRYWLNNVTKKEINLIIFLMKISGYDLELIQRILLHLLALTFVIIILGFRLRSFN